ncbi:hypothetical protein [Cellulophaga baltica]|uniref:Uncharacterized protein n=1 Tax=Cellulophaga baltica TaxID=76594 RepID=A0A1G7LYY1_9FLAO|nr:hypothetical protein [Cellulophaga baltica]SDF54768.1 hypothetical protein SAMN04487992_12411 [Cellulophaga baltica]
MPQKEKPKKLYYVIIAISIVVLLYGQFKDDIHFQGSSEIGTEITVSEFNQLKKQKDSDGKRYSIIGHASISNSDITRVIGRPLKIIFKDADNNYIERFELYLGEGKNEFYLPNKFTPEDLVLFDNEGNKHAYNENVRLSFTFKRIKNAIPERDEETGEYVWSYNQIRIDPVK